MTTPAQKVLVWGLGWDNGDCCGVWESKTWMPSFFPILLFWLPNITHTDMTPQEARQLTSHPPITPSEWESSLTGGTRSDSRTVQPCSKALAGVCFVECIAEDKQAQPVGVDAHALPETVLAVFWYTPVAHYNSAVACGQTLTTTESGTCAPQSVRPSVWTNPRSDVSKSATCQFERPPISSCCITRQCLTGSVQCGAGPARYSKIS